MAGYGSAARSSGRAPLSPSGSGRSSSSPSRSSWLPRVTDPPSVPTASPDGPRSANRRRHRAAADLPLGRCPFAGRAIRAATSRVRLTSPSPAPCPARPSRPSPARCRVLLARQARQRSQSRRCRGRARRRSPPVTGTHGLAQAGREAIGRATDVRRARGPHGLQLAAVSRPDDDLLRTGLHRVPGRRRAAHPSRPGHDDLLWRPGAGGPRGRRRGGRSTVRERGRLRRAARRRSTRKIRRRHTMGLQPIVVVVDDGNGYRSMYVHLSKALVKVGDHVRHRTVIGLEGRHRQRQRLPRPLRAGAHGRTAGCASPAQLVKEYGYPAWERERVDPLRVLDLKDKRAGRFVPGPPAPEAPGEPPPAEVAHAARRAPACPLGAVAS